MKLSVIRSGSQLLILVGVGLAACSEDGAQPAARTADGGATSTVARTTETTADSAGPAPTEKVQQRTPAQAIGSGPAVRKLAGVTVTTRYRYYDIAGFSGPQLRAQMDRRGPRNPTSGRRADASTDWWVASRYRYGGSTSGCAVTAATVSLRLKYTYPRWRGWSHARSYFPELASVWVHYLGRLSRHEERHGKIALQGPRRLSRGLGAFPAYATCSGLERAITTFTDTIVRQTNRLQKNYDRRTRHGATEGVRFS
jgi:predicted secreted Zn-dependent protease